MYTKWHNILTKTKSILSSKPAQCVLLHAVSIGFLDSFFSPLNALDNLKPLFDSLHFVANGHDYAQILLVKNWKHLGSHTCVLSSLSPTV